MADVVKICGIAKYRIVSICGVKQIKRVIGIDFLVIVFGAVMSFLVPSEMGLTEGHTIEGDTVKSGDGDKWIATISKDHADGQQLVSGAPELVATNPDELTIDPVSTPELLVTTGPAVKEGDEIIVIEDGTSKTVIARGVEQSTSPLPQNGLLAHYDMELATSTLVPDVSGHGRNMTLSGKAPTFGVRENGSRYIKGAGDDHTAALGTYGFMSAGAGVMTSAGCSYGFWIKRDSTLTGYQYFGGITQNGSIYGYLRRSDTDGLKWFVAGGPFALTDMTADVWEHHFFVRDSTSVKQYINGVLATTINGLTALSGITENEVISLFSLGSYIAYYRSGSSFDDYVFYNRPLTEVEALQVYNVTKYSTIISGLSSAPSKAYLKPPVTFDVGYGVAGEYSGSEKFLELTEGSTVSAVKIVSAKSIVKDVYIEGGEHNNIKVDSQIFVVGGASEEVVLSSVFSPPKPYGPELGEAFAISSANDMKLPIYAFDGDSTYTSYHYWASLPGTPTGTRELFVGWKFLKPTKVTAYEFVQYASTQYGTTSLVLQGSNDNGVTWEDVQIDTVGAELNSKTITNPKFFRWYRFTHDTPVEYYWIVKEISFTILQQEYVATVNLVTPLSQVPIVGTTTVSIPNRLSGLPCATSGQIVPEGLKIIGEKIIFPDDSKLRSMCMAAKVPAGKIVKDFKITPERMG